MNSSLGGALVTSRTEMMARIVANGKLGDFINLGPTEKTH